MYHLYYPLHPNKPMNPADPRGLSDHFWDHLKYFILFSWTRAYPWLTVRKS
jgi:hypothetical protein